MMARGDIPIERFRPPWDSKPMAKKTFLELLRERIDQDPDLTEAGLAEKAGLDNSTIRQMFARGTSPRIATIEKICAALGETVDSFMSSDLSPEEAQVLRLMRSLPLDLRRQILGYSQALHDGHQSPE